ncbi:hypothetical protein M9980_12920 [Sphingomonas donggukensis]|uniref:Uncharacterized protein n=1 Tax=Sphingomonas donggukensis TaxID=2949093 RepID=A0ABY4TUP5_9SPHN|nr:hypothetical protein [Sphingomonas donggukensis]URW75421.1 hypothetical protein M9980_12920 [Sphingomonas donggukensis]
MRGVLCLAALAALLPGCGHAPREIAAAPPPLPQPVAVQPMPLPPAGAAANLTIPTRLADGSFDTPNRGASGATAVWHLRAALNVAALRCNDDALLANYNAMLRVHRAAFSAAHTALQREAGAAFDTGMTRLYNYFALPNVQASFCTAAATVAAKMAAEPKDFADYAPLALGVLDAPFTNFFDRYAAYRADLAAWNAGRTAPRLAYDSAVVLAEGPPRGATGYAVAAR